MRKFGKKRKYVKIISVLISVVLVAVLFYSAIRLRKIIVNYAQSRAASIAFKIANDTINRVITDENVSYNNIVNLSRNTEGAVSSLEIDVVRINRLKTEISSAIEEKMGNNENFKIGIPIGTLFGNEYTVGLGPELKFNMKLTATAVTDFKSNFYAAGINQVLHQVLITVKISGTLVLPWARGGFSAETTVIAAQTVLVGLVPDAYTNVDETTVDGQPQVVGDIFDYGAEAEK
ncbi:MAG: sporulation protein YunB [Clostridiales bacterium]|nr:sporulation protein YunB [Candidatus Equinaster intestinalis]